MVDANDQTFWTVGVWTYGRVEIQFKMLSQRPPFDTAAHRMQLLSRLNNIPGVNIPQSKVDQRPSIQTLALIEPKRIDLFIGVLDWLVACLRSGKIESDQPAAPAGA